MAFFQNNKYGRIIQDFSSAYNIIPRSLTSLEQDASFRRYSRINTNKGNYLIMDCFDEQGSFLPFLQIQNLLKSNDILVPEVFLVDSDNFSAVIQDLGNNRMKDIILNKNIDEQYQYYLSALNLMQKIQSIPVDQEFAKYSYDKLLKGIETFINWYLPYQKIVITEDERNEFLGLWQTSFQNLSQSKLVLNLLDFHAENLMLFNDQLYAIDFQDAHLSWSGYDLVSLLQDARYELSSDLALQLFHDYCKIRKINAKTMFSDYNILGAQRNARILGVFACKYIKCNNDKYLKLIPLVLKYLKDNLNALDVFIPIKLWLLNKGIL